MPSRKVTVHMLLIEPDPDSRSIIAKALTMNFPTIKLDLADNTETALALVRRKIYDAVVCDAFLMRTDKVNFVNEVCAEKPGVPLLIITAHSDISPADFEGFPQSLCFHDVLHKPIDLQDLIEKIRGAIGRIAERRAVKI